MFRRIKRRGNCAYLVLAVNSVTTANAAGNRTSACWTVIAPAGTPLSVRTIAGHMTGVTADTTNDVRSVVLLLGTVILAMANLTTVLAGLVLVITQSSVQGSEFTKLVTLELVLSLGYRCCLVRLLAFEKLALREWGDPSLTVSITLWISFLALFTFSSVSAMIKQCKSSSWLLECAASERPLPSLTEPFPRIAILAPDSDSIFLRVLPRGPMSSPT